MKVVNKTKWNTADLKKIFVEAKRLYKKDTGETHGRKKLVIEVIYCTSRPYSGIAYIGGTCLHSWDMKLRLPRETEDKKLDCNTVAWIFTHEYEHILGYRHPQMGKIRWDDSMFDWAKNYTVGLEPIKEKPKRDLKNERYLKACKKVEEKIRKLKRLKNELKKWDAKKKYYEKNLAMAAQNGKEINHDEKSK